jgi:large subunit ribosomal protein L18
MPNPQKKRAKQRRLKALRVRKGLRGSAERPRLSVSRSLRNISCQVIDDDAGHTLAAVSSLDKSLRAALKGMNKTDAARKVGAELAARAKKAGVEKVSFDRGARRYHGRIKALAEAARESGLVF